MAGTFRPTVIYLICRPFAVDDDDDYSDAHADDDGEDDDDDDDEPVKRIKQVKGQIYNNGRWESSGWGWSWSWGKH